MTPEKHRARAVKHEEVGNALAAAAQDEWAAVCWFYACYHIVKAELLCDPVFDDPEFLASCQPSLLPQDRDVKQHQARAGGKDGGRGMKEVIKALYPEIRASHSALHHASIQVRYEGGYPLPLDRVREHLVTVKEWSEARTP